MAAAATMMTDQNLESRVARLESDVAHIRSDVAEIKMDIRDLREKLLELDRSVRAEMGELKVSLSSGLASTRIWMLLQSAAILGIMGR